MSKRDEFWQLVPRGADGHIQWPDDVSERTQLVRSAFGAKVIGAIEAVVKEHFDIVNGVPPDSVQTPPDAARRAAFACMSDAQRARICDELRLACFGTLYWILVKLEHFPYADVNFTATPFTPDGMAFPVIGIEETELHHLYFEWVEEFSEYGDE